MVKGLLQGVEFVDSNSKDSGYGSFENWLSDCVRNNPFGSELRGENRGWLFSKKINSSWSVRCPVGEEARPLRTLAQSDTIEQETPLTNRSARWRILKGLLLIAAC